MAAQQEQGQRVVAALEVLGVGGGREDLAGQRRGRGLAAPAGPLAAQLVGQPPGGDADQPALRTVGDALGGPLGRGGQQRLLYGVLGGLEVALVADERGEDPRRQRAQQVLDAGPRRHISWPDRSMIGRTSTAANRASGKRAAISVARSRLSQSTTK
jgi:hypothetical protein